MVDSESGIKSTYYYDLIDRLCRYEEAGQDYSFIMEYAFDDRNQVSQMVQTIDGNRRPIEITYDDDGQVTSCERQGCRIKDRRRFLSESVKIQNRSLYYPG